MVWSRGRVIGELARLARGGHSTKRADLMQAGRADLVLAAAVHAGGLVRARVAAGVAQPRRQSPVPRWKHAAIVRAIRDRVRGGETLASSMAPQDLVAAARWHFGSWEAALAAAGVDAAAARLRRGAYTELEIVALVRRLAREGDVRPSTLRTHVRLDTVRKLFGSVPAAIRAAGVAASGHGNQRWSRQRVLDELGARAERGIATLTPALRRAVRLYFGGADAARRAAGMDALVRPAWTKQSLVDELRRRAGRGDSGRTLWAACTRLFGSVAAARRAAGVPVRQRTGMATWDRAALVAELRRRVRSRQQLSRGLTAGLRQHFGSLAAARAAARVARSPAVSTSAAEAGTSWSRAQLVERLRSWSAGGGPLPPGFQRACRQCFGSLARALAAAGIGKPAVRWTPDRIRRALCEPSFDAANPTFVAACIAHFGSVTAARAAAAREQRGRTWSRAQVIAELQARSHRGLRGVGRLLREPAVRLFGSTDAALAAARTRSPR